MLLQSILILLMANYDFSELNSTGQDYNGEVMNKIIDAARNANYSDAQIAALLANAMYESGHDPNANHKNLHFGMLQWKKSQLGNFKLGDVDSQIAYMIEDVMRGRWPQGGDTWNGWNPVHFKTWSDPKASVEALSDAFESGYERRGKTSINRRRAARVIYNIITRN